MKVGKRKSSDEMESKLVWLILMLEGMQVAYLWVVLHEVKSNSPELIVGGFFCFSAGLYNVLAFLWGFETFTIGGQEDDYKDRLMGLVFGLFFLTGGIYLPVAQ